MLNIDLHCHSTISDGLLTPAQLVERAALRGVETLALTDHDDIAGLAEARQTAAAKNITFINGVEISVSWRGRTLHIVGLDIDPEYTPLIEGLTAIRAGRSQRAANIAAELERIGIHGSLEGEEHGKSSGAGATMSSVVGQIIVIDIVFSLDSVITAVGMTNQVPVMITAVVLAMIVMMIASGAISAFVNRHPTVKMLALSFLILVGVMLVAEGFGQHVNKGYIYFAMAFSLVVELLNMRMRKPKPVVLHEPHMPKE